MNEEPEEERKAAQPLLAEPLERYVIQLVEHAPNTGSLALVRATDEIEGASARALGS